MTKTKPTERTVKLNKETRIVLNMKNHRLGSIFGASSFTYTIFLNGIFFTVPKKRICLWLKRPVKITFGE